MNMREMLMMFGAISAGGGTAQNSNSLRPSDIKINRKTPVPRGCKQYWFNRAGEFTTVAYEGKNYSAFTCVASNDKIAMKKFEKWKQPNSSGSTTTDQ
jgi:hypothetical protein